MAPGSDSAVDRSPQIIGAQCACIALAIIGVLGRVLSRRLVRARYWIDDWLIIVALVLYIGASIDGFICVALGAGNHEDTLSNPQAFAEASYAFIVLYRPTIALVKFSVLFLYRRLFPQLEFRRILEWYGYLVLLYTTIFLVLDIFHCRPVSGAWRIDKPSNCLNMDIIWLVGGSLNAVTDIGALCLPMPLLWRLRVEKEKRLQVMGVFLLGGFVCIVSIVRVIELGGLSAEDASYAYSKTIVWSTVESGVGILSACLPVMRPILIAVKQRTIQINLTDVKQTMNTKETFNTHTNIIDSPLKHHARGSDRPADLEDTEPFASADASMSVDVRRQESLNDLHNLDPELGENGIAVTTRIEHQYKPRASR